MSHKKRLCAKKSRAESVKADHNYHSYKAYKIGKMREKMGKEGRRNARKHD